MTEAFLQWPLPESVCIDLCATKRGKGRIGANLLSFTEANAMLKDVVSPRLSELVNQRENMCVFITRLCRQSYKLGLKNKLTDSAMGYINKTDAANTPATKLLREVLKS